MTEELSDLDDLLKILVILIQHARNKNWNNLYAKWTRNFYETQSLLVHSINQASVIIELFKNIIPPNAFTHEERIVAVVGAFLSDSGKALEKFQFAVIQKSREPDAYDHVTSEALSIVKSFLEEIKGDITPFLTGTAWTEFIKRVLQAVCHHQSLKAKKLMGECSKYGAKSTTSLLIDFVDDLVSAKRIEEAVRIGKNMDSALHILGNIEFEYHKLTRIRGILSVFLNQALIIAFKKRKYHPILYFPEGVLYVSKQKTKTPLKISKEEIHKEIIRMISEIFNSPLYENNIYNAVFGPITQTIVILPEFLQIKMIKQKLKEQIPNASKLKKDIEKTFEKLSKAKKSKKKGKIIPIEYFKEKARENGITLELLIEHYVKYKTLMTFFYAILEILVSWDQEKKSLNNNHLSKILQKYFPFLTLDILKSGYANSARFDKKLNLFLESWRDNKKNLLIKNTVGNVTFVNNLSNVLEDIYDFVKSNRPPLIDKKVVDFLLLDVNHPMITPKIETSNMFEKINMSFQLDKTDSDSFNCFFCHLPSIDVVKSDLVGDGSQKFSNQLVGGKIFGKEHKARFCCVCRLEAILRKILVGQKPAEIILLVPEINMGPELRERWKKEIQTFQTSRKRDISLVNSITLRKVIKMIATADSPTFLELDGSWVARNIIVGNEKRKKRVKILKENYDNIKNFNNAYNTKFKSFEEVVDAIFKLEWWEDDLETFFEPATQINYVYETPNYLLMLLRFEYKENEEPTSSAYLRKLVLGILISLIFNCKVKFIKNLNPVLHHEFKGIVTISDTPIIHDLNKIFNPEGIITLHNRWKVLKHLTILMTLENEFEKPEKDFLLKYMKYSRGFILNKLRQQKKVSDEILDLLGKLPAFIVK